MSTEHLVLPTEKINMSLNGNSCGNCRYYRINPADFSQGMCKRLPPQVFAVPVGMNAQRQVQLEVSASYPGMQKDDGCGEFVVRGGQTVGEQLLGVLQGFILEKKERAHDKE